MDWSGHSVRAEQVQPRLACGLAFPGAAALETPDVVDDGWAQTLMDGDATLCLG